MIEINWNPSLKELRIFAILQLVFFTIIIGLIYRHAAESAAAIAILAVSATITLTGLLKPIWIRHIQVYAHPDVIYREFENGLVLANPSRRPYMIDLNEHFSGQTFKRLQGTTKQDTVCNDGSLVHGELNIQPKEGLFLIKTN